MVDLSGRSRAPLRAISQGCSRFIWIQSTSKIGRREIRPRPAGWRRGSWRRSGSPGVEVLAEVGPVERVAEWQNLPVVARCGVARSRRGYHHSGTEISRPSWSATYIRRSSKRTSANIASASPPSHDIRAPMMRPPPCDPMNAHSLSTGRPGRGILPSQVGLQPAP